MFDHFGLLAPVYEKFIKPKPPEILKELLGLPIAGSLLDVGGGTGRVSHFFTKGTGSVYLADLSHEMLVQSHTKEGLRPVCSHSEKLPFPDGFFERIIMIDALHHVCDQTQTAAELWRVLKPGGRIIIEEPDIHHWAVKLIALVEKIALMRSHFLNPAAIASLFSTDDTEPQIFQEEYIAWVVIDK
ncbi:MAG: class I SAM-dependent methyltransferase [Chloroflexi bacterium]|nr:class I SAM-dependent methyltransferase [Chloroflexota bacterium]